MVYGLLYTIRPSEPGAWGHSQSRIGAWAVRRRYVAGGVTPFQRVSSNVPGGLGKSCGWNVGSDASYAQLSPLIPRFPRCRPAYAKTMMLRALKGAATVPAVRFGATRRRNGASPRRSGGRESRYQPQSGIPPMSPGPEPVLGRVPVASSKNHCPGVRSLPRVRPREGGFSTAEGVFQKRGAWPAPREVSGASLVGARCRCPRTCIPDASSFARSPFARFPELV